MRDLIPTSWTNALLAIQQMCSSAVIAGGALRDLDNGRPIRDVDIFISGSDERDLHRCYGAFREAGWDIDELDPDGFYPVGENNEVFGYFNAHAPSVEYPFNIIVVRWPTSQIVDRFDFGICKIAFNGSDVVKHPDYVIDKEAKQFRICRERDPDQLRASIKRYGRLSRKYQDWDFRLFKQTVPDDLFF